MKKKSIIPVIVLIALVGALAWAVSLLNHQTDLHHDHEDEAPPPAASSGGKESTGGKASLAPGRLAVLKTSRGEIRFVMFEKDAPITTKNFVSLVQSSFYKDFKWHRVEDWVIQTGDPTGTGRGGSKKMIPLEVKEGLGFGAPYTVGMARTQDPNSASSQFFITKKSSDFLNGQYAAFGIVVAGQDVVEQIKKDDKLVSVTVTDPSKKDLESFKKQNLQ